MKKSKEVRLWNWQETRSIMVNDSELDKYDTRMWKVVKRVRRPMFLNNPGSKRKTVITLA